MKTVTGGGCDDRLLRQLSAATAPEVFASETGNYHLEAIGCDVVTDSDWWLCWSDR